MSIPANPTHRDVSQSDDDFRSQLRAKIERAVDDRLDALQRAGLPLSSLGEPADLAERVVSALPAATHPLDVELGPFYDTSGLSTWWKVSRQALADRVRRGTLLACRTEDGHLVYPAFQFARDGGVRAGIVDAVAEFTRHGVDGWTTAVWLTTASPVFDGDSAVDHLVVHRSSAAAVDRIRRQAHADAGSLVA